MEIDAPAKLNLGLEVIGRRDDGFHEIATIMLAIDIYDTLRLAPDSTITMICADPALAGEDNLALKALHVLRDEMGFTGGAQLDLIKRIPAASGLGGASSDAAAALLGSRELWRLDVADDTLHSIAARLGSDVPFFLHAGCAVGHGRGDVITLLPTPSETWFVVVVPDLSIPNKTATLYARLRPEDFSDGARIADQVARLQSGLSLDFALCENAFVRPLYEVAPWLADLPGLMVDAGAGSVAISGAGSAHYSPFATMTEAESTAERLRDRLGDRARIFVAGAVPPRRARHRPL